MSESWLLWAVLSTFCYGFYAFLFKKLIEDGGDVHLAQIIMPSVVTVLGIVAFYLSESFVSENMYLLFIFAALQGILFFATTESRLQALETGMPSNVVFPIIKSGTVFVILISAVIFDEWVKFQNPFLLAGVVLSVGVMFLLIDFRKQQNKQLSVDGLKLAMLAAISSVGASLAPKYVINSQEDTNIFLFIVVSNLVTLLMARVKHHGHRVTSDQTVLWKTLYWSVAMGILSFIGFSAFLKAIVHGSLSIVAAVSSLYIIIPVILSAKFYSESFNYRSQVAVLLSVVAMALIATAK